MSKQNGFTLLDLLTTMAVVGITMTLGVPSMAALIRGNNIVAETNDLVATLHTARNEAVNNVEQVTVCKSTNQSTCNNGATWADGWIVFVDNDQDETRDLAGTPEVLLLAQEALSGSNSLHSAAFNNWIAFRPDGLSIGSGANAGKFSLCNEAGTDYARDINISRTGSPSITNADEGACQ